MGADWGKGTERREPTRSEKLNGTLPLLYIQEFSASAHQLLLRFLEQIVGNAPSISLVPGE